LAGFSKSSILTNGKSRFLQLAADLVWLNPHLTLSCTWDGELVVDKKAIDPSWGERKWRPSDPTSAYWYDVDRFSRYIAAHINRDRCRGGRGHSIREFVAELRGITSTARQQAVRIEAVRDDAGLTARRHWLDPFFDEGRNEEGVARLLAACQKHTKPVKPKTLGFIGKDNLRGRLLGVGAEEKSIKYKRKELVDPDGLPCIIETAFGWRPKANERRIVTGINWSPAIGDPFPTLGAVGRSLSSILANQRAESDEPIVFVAHLVMPRAQFIDRGKSVVRL
jgi:hypothetical protein